MSRIRILLAGATSDLRSMVHDAVAGQHDLLIVGETSGEVETLLEAGRIHVEVVIVGMRGAELPPVAERLLDEYPRLGVLAVDLDRDEGMLYRLSPRVTRISDIRITGLAGMVRQIAPERRG